VDEIVDDVREHFPDLEVTGLPIIGRILRLCRFLETRREEQLAQFGLTLGDFDMLATMRRRAADQPINIRELQRSLMLSSGGTTKRLDRLEAAGLIERLPDPTDRRGVLIGLSPAGRTVIDEAVPAITSYETSTVKAAIDSAAVRAAVEDGLRRMLIAQETASAETP
jgi:DNA-binding MarR family transcriptional regulator